jgi:hypothetical protein
VKLFIGYGLIALIVAGLLFYAVVALLPDGLQFKTERDQRPFELPTDRRMVREDLDRLRIPVSLRGYRFAETDDLIDRLAAEIVVRDEEIARLRQGDRSSPPPADDQDSGHLGDPAAPQHQLWDIPPEDGGTHRHDV